MTVVTPIVWVLTGVYILVLCYFLLGIIIRTFFNPPYSLRSSKRSFADTTRDSQNIIQSQPLTASVIVCARNEERSIRKCIQSLLSQTIPVQIIIVDDRSTDSTPVILASFGDAITVVRIDTCPEGVSPKKNALLHGIRYAHGDILMLTDADCTVPLQWVELHCTQYADSIGLCAGLVFVKEKNFWHRLINFELYALSLCTAGAIGMGNPMIATGNNLSYRKSAYLDAGGIEPLLLIDSGDDDLMVQAIARTGKWGSTFCSDPRSFVATEPVESVSAFIRQRRRWASRGLDYPWWLIMILGSIYMMFVVFAVVPIGLTLSFASWRMLIVPIVSACCMEIIVLTAGFYIFKRLSLLIYYPIVKILHVPYILLMPILGIFRGFTWK